MLAEALDPHRTILRAGRDVGEATTTAAPPKHGITISSMCSGSAMTGLASTSSIVSGVSFQIAPSVWLALTRWSTTIFAIARSS